MDILNKLREELQVERWQVEAAVKLIDEGNTIPFISRYRKEATGSLNDEVLRNLYERLNYLRNLEEKKTSVMASIEEQGKLTDDLKNKILAAETLVVVEDLYRPYRPKRKTRASVAKEKGLDVQMVKAPMALSGRYLAENPKGTGFCKLLYDRKNRCVVGVHLVGSYASEIIYGAAMMVHSKLPVQHLDKIVFPHPTVGEVVREALFLL